MSHAEETDLIELMAECADQVMAGASVTACLERYPDQAAELKPLLNAVLDIHQWRAIPERAPAVAAQRRAQFLAAANALGPVGEKTRVAVVQLAEGWRALCNWGANLLGTRGLPRMLPSGLAATLLIVLLSGLLLTGILTVSADALPGNLLYPAKTAAERVQILLTFDIEARDRLLAEIEERRIEEARAVVELRHKVTNVPLQGTIEAIADHTWTVSGLTITIAPDSQIIGTPQVGSRVKGQVRAPGDGSLIVRYVEIEPPAQAWPAVPPALTPTLTLTSPIPTARATNAVTLTPTASSQLPSGGDRRAFPEPFDQPTETATAQPTASATTTETRTATPTPTRTATASVTATRTQTAVPPREIIKGRVIGRVERIEGIWWTIEGVTVQTNAETRFGGDPVVGSKVEVIFEIKPDGSYVALSIVEIAPPDRPPEPLEFTGTVQSINGSVWTIEGVRVTVSGDTILENSPGVGDLVEVKAERYADGEVRALRITAIRDVVVYFDGVIEAMSGDTWRIGGHPVIISAETQIIGEAAIGAWVQVEARQMPDGRLIAQIIVVVEPVATPTVVPVTVTPTVTQAPGPPATDTPQATATPTSGAEGMPTPTATWAPTPTGAVTP